MTLISVVVTSSFVSLMSDGRMTSADGQAILKEDCQKFILPDQQSFVAIAGSVDVGEPFAVNVGKNIGSVVDYLQNVDLKFDSDFSLIVGKVLPEGVQLCTFTSREGMTGCNIVRKGMNAIAILVSPFIDRSVVERRLKDLLDFSNWQDVSFAQESLNDFVAARDSTVNRNVFSHLIPV